MQACAALAGHRVTYVKVHGALSNLACEDAMMANAIGPQNTVQAMGIMPSTVEIAVSMIGRKRAALASTAAFHTSLPAARSAWCRSARCG
jgi:lactam utilization protein B